MVWNTGDTSFIEPGGIVGTECPCMEPGKLGMEANGKGTGSPPAKLGGLGAVIGPCMESSGPAVAIDPSGLAKPIEPGIIVLNSGASCILPFIGEWSKWQSFDTIKYHSKP